MCTLSCIYTFLNRCVICRWMLSWGRVRQSSSPTWVNAVVPVWHVHSDVLCRCITKGRDRIFRLGVTWRVRNVITIFHIMTGALCFEPGVYTRVFYLPLLSQVCHFRNRKWSWPSMSMLNGMAASFRLIYHSRIYHISPWLPYLYNTRAVVTITRWLTPRRLLFKRSKQTLSPSIGPI